MKNLSVLKFLFASSLLAAAAARAQVTPLYGATAGTVGQVAIATTELAVPGSFGRPTYVVAAVVNGSNNLEVIAWQDTFSKLVRIGSASPADANPNIGLGSTVAAVGLDANRVVTADVDDTGTLNVDTWQLGGKSGISLQFGASTPASTAQTVAITRLSDTQVVTAYQNSSGELTVEAWNIDAIGIPTPAGMATGGTAGQIGIAAVSPTQVVTAEQDSEGHLKVIAWVVGTVSPVAGVEIGTVTRQGDYTDSLAGMISIGGFGGEAVTAAVNGSSDLETVTWKVSATGSIVPLARSTSGNASAVAGAELPVEGIAVTAARGSTGNLDVDVWREGREAGHDQMDTPIGSIAMAPDGTGILSGGNYYAYFVTAAQNSQGNLDISMWSYLYQQIIQ